jgi:hypothetical protein
VTDTFMGRDMSTLSFLEQQVLRHYYELGLDRTCEWFGMHNVEIENIRLDALMKLGMEELIASEEARR